MQILLTTFLEQDIKRHKIELIYKSDVWHLTSQDSNSLLQREHHDGERSKQGK